MKSNLDPSTPPPKPVEGGVTLQANAINVSGDFVGRDKTTNNITNIIHKFFLGGANEERDRRNRRIMLDKVRTFWVKGVLEQSLYGAALIELGMEYKPDAVQYPWETVLQRPDHSAEPLPRGAKMIDVFDEEGGELLILGAPGSGKTTMLLDLARDLITRAEQDETLPIPVVFNLSSWAEKHPPLAEWLIEELSFRYDVPKKVGQAWIEKDQVFPLLDGLDEVKLEQRVGCVEAINNFRKEHLIHVAVCSRSAEYEALRAQLRLQNAVVLQPLTREQVDTYLESAGEQLASVRTFLQHDGALQELAESPLILSVIVLAYRDLDMSSLPVLDSSEKQREHLFDTYIQRMFERRGADKRYMPQQVTHWLSWLARRMVEHSQTTFYLERIWMAWLPTQSQRWFYAIATKLVIQLSLGLGAGPAIGLGIRLTSGSGSWLVGGLSSGLVGGLGAGLFAALVGGVSEIKSVERVRWSWQAATKAAVGFGLVYGLSYGMSFGLVGGLFAGLNAGLVGAWVAGLRGGLLAAGISEIKTVERLRWSWPDAARAGLVGVLVSVPVWGLFYGLVREPVNQVFFGSFSPLVNRLIDGLGLGLSAGLIIGLLAGLVAGLKIGDEIETKTRPNQGIWSSAQNAILSGLVVVLLGGPFIGLVAGLMYRPTGELFSDLGISLVAGPFVLSISGLVTGLLGGVGLSLVIVMFHGGIACIQHFTLRLMLYRNGSIPLNYVRFLDYCAERIFLRKVGGGYIFVHRLLMEHFAGLASPKATSE